MKNSPKIILPICLLLLASVSHTQTAKRIACIGTGITYGEGMSRRELNSYPSQLQAILGEGYDVRNYGVPGATAGRNGAGQYFIQEECRDARDWKPDLVCIELGSYDTAPGLQVAPGSFRADFTALVESFSRIPSKPRIILLSPPLQSRGGASAIPDTTVRDQIVPAIQLAAYETGCEIIDLYRLLLGRPACLRDQGLLSPVGAGVIAARLYEAITMAPARPVVLPEPILEESVSSNYYGFRCLDFSFQGRSAKIVSPHRQADGAPWIWRARFWGHEPQTEIALLERGFTLVYCDVAELFGDEEAVRIWNGFYSMLTSAGFSPRVVLEGFSRAGVYMYRWAVSNPGKVACVYADAPVLDFKSWPGGKGKSHGNPEEWQRFKDDFGLHSEEEAISFKGNPIDLVEEIAGEGFPVLHVCGDADITVPIEENTDVFERKMLAAGGRITVIRKPGIGHHPHSLPNPQPIVDFILRAVNRKINFASLPAPGNEYRPGAGWADGMEWHAVFDEMNRIGERGEDCSIIFFGNSITQGIGGTGRSLTVSPGDSAFSAAFHAYRWVNFGISGDRTQQCLWRVMHGNWQRLHPQCIVLTIGVNNFPDDSGEEVGDGIRKIIEAIMRKDSGVRILLVGPLPAREPGSTFRAKFENVQRELDQWAGSSFIVRSKIPSLMLAPDGSLRTGLFSSDGIHLTGEGYAEFARLLVREIETAHLARPGR